MNLRQIFVIFLSLLFSITFTYSVGLYNENGDYTFYVSSDNASINISILNQDENIIVDNISVNGEVIPINMDILSNAEQIYSYKLSDFSSDFVPMSKGNEYDVVFNARMEDGTVLKYLGNIGSYTPTEFNLEYDDTIPRLLTPTNDLVFTPNSRSFSFSFSKTIKKYTITLNGKVIRDYKESSSLKSEYMNSFDIAIPVENLVEGRNGIEFSFEDIYGVKNTQVVDAYYRSVDIEVELLTRADDNSLDYYFNQEHFELFKDKIYFSETPFDIKVRTNTKAKCYGSDSLIGFRNFNDYRGELEQFSSTSDGLVHSREYDGTFGLWVACTNSNYESDVAHLSVDIMDSEELIFMEEYTSDFDIEYALPQISVTQNPFNLAVKTTNQGICYVDYGLGETLMDTADYKSHSLNDVSLSDGSYNFNYRCFDKVYNEKKETVNLNVNSLGNPQVVSYEPRYLSSSSSTITVTLTEEISCKYSKEQVPASEFNTLTSLSGDGLSKTMQLSGLIEGDNDIYLYCEESGQVFSLNVLELIYDPRGPIISNFTFMNNGVASDYLNNFDSIEMDFDIDYIIPIDKYFVEVQGSNSSYTIEKSTKPSKLFGDYEDTKSISLIVRNRAGVNSSKSTKKIQFDVKGPELSVKKKGDSFTIDCNDIKSGCSKILYGFSEKSSDCTPRLTYKDGKSVKINNRNYVCILGIDKAGNEETLTRSLFGFGFDGAGIPEDSAFDDNETELEEGILDEILDDPFQSTPFEQNEDSSGNGLIIAAIALAFVTLSGTGSYYAYRKGYLDTQLEKFGILKEHKDVKNEITQEKVQNTEPIQEKVLPKVDPKDRYDARLRKLNKFIDETLGEDEQLFDNFKGVGKGNVKNYEDTLLNKKVEGKSISKEDLEVFNEGSKGKKKSTSNNIEQEGKEFESYLKKKKEMKSKLDDLKSKKKDSNKKKK